MLEVLQRQKVVTLKCAIFTGLSTEFVEGETCRIMLSLILIVEHCREEYFKRFNGEMGKQRYTWDDLSGALVIETP